MDLGINDIRNTQNIQNLKSAKRQDDSFADTIQLPNRDMSGGHAPYDYLAKELQWRYLSIRYQAEPVTSGGHFRQVQMSEYPVVRRGLSGCQQRQSGAVIRCDQYV